MKKAFLLMAMMLTLSAPVWAQEAGSTATDTTTTTTATDEATTPKAPVAKEKASARQEKRGKVHAARQEKHKALSKARQERRSKIKEKATSSSETEAPATTGTESAE